MRALAAVFAILLAGASAAQAAGPGPLTSLHAMRALSNTEATQKLPCRLSSYCDLLPLL